MKVAPVQEQVLAARLATDLQDKQLLAAGPVQVAQLEWHTIAAQLPLTSIEKPALQEHTVPASAAFVLQEAQVDAVVQVLQVLEQGWQTPVASM